MDNSKYKKLPYIHSVDSNSRLLIDIIFNPDNVINYITYVLDDPLNSCICSTGGGSTYDPFRLHIGIDRYSYGWYKSVHYGYTINTGRYDFVVSGKGYVKVNGDEISKEKEDTDWTKDWSLYGIHIGSDGSLGMTRSQNFIGCVLYNNLDDYNNGIYSHNLIPCERLKDNVVGVYDLVTDKFYRSIEGGWVAPIDLSEVTSIRIREGKVTKIEDKEGNILWTSANNQTTTLDT